MQIRYFKDLCEPCLDAPEIEYKIVIIQPDLTRHMMEYQSMDLLSDRVLQYRQIPVNKSGMTWNWSFNALCKSLKGILVLFKSEQLYTLDTSKFYKLHIQKVSVIVEGKSNQLYTQGM